MRNNVLKLLSFFNRKETIFETIFTLLLLSFLGSKIGIDRHEACHSSNILIFESLQNFHNSFGRRFCSNIQEDTNLRVELSAKAFKKP